jgi:hypothetical protein
MSNYGIGTIIEDSEGSNIIATVKSKKDNTGAYQILLEKKGYVSTLVRQKSLPKSEKEQKTLIDKWEKSLKKSGKKSKKCNKHVSYAVHVPGGHTFKVSSLKKSSPKPKIFISKTGRKFTITTTTRKSPKSKKIKRGGGRKRRTRRKSSRKRKRRSRRKRRRRRRGGTGTT